MEQIINKYKLILSLIIIGIVLLTLKSCNESKIDQLYGENKIKKEIVKKLQKEIDSINKVRLVEKDSIATENIKKEAKLKGLKYKELASLDKIKNLKREALKTKAQLRDLNLVGVANELNITYGGKNATAGESSIDIKGFLPYQILETKVDANACQDIIKEKDIQLTIKDSVISVKDSKLKDSSILLFSAEKSIKGFKELNQIQEELNTSLQKENKKIRVKNTLNTILIPVVAIISIYGGYKLAK